MKAIVYDDYGSPDVLRCEDVEKSTPNDDDVLIRIRAASANPLDCHFMRGEPYLLRLMTGAAKTKGEMAFGAHVTGVCSTRNVDLVRSIGADHVIDYTQDDFTSSTERYDLILNAAGNRSLLACRRVMTPGGIYVWVGGPGDRGIGAFAGWLKALLLSRFVSHAVFVHMTSMKQDDLIILKELVGSRKVIPVIGRRCTLIEAPEAIRYLEEGHAGGKAVISVDQAADPLLSFRDQRCSPSG